MEADALRVTREACESVRGHGDEAVTLVASLGQAVCRMIRDGRQLLAILDEVGAHVAEAPRIAPLAAEAILYWLTRIALAEMMAPAAEPSPPRPGGALG